MAVTIQTPAGPSVSLPPSQSGVVPFRRPPRFRPPLDAQELRLPAPPSPPTSGSWRTAIPTFAAAFIFAAIMALQMGSANTGAVVAIFVASLLLPLSAIVADRWSRRDAFKTSMALYLEDLRAAVATIEERGAAEATVRRETDPSASDLIAAVHQGKLWERRPAHSDFLRVRWGTGQERARVTAAIEPDSPARVPTPSDPRLAQLMKDFSKAEMLQDVPLVVDLRTLGSLGIIGYPAAATRLGVALACHILAHHGPDDVRLVAVYGGHATGSWEWLKWAPHTQNFANSSITDRLMACNGRQQRRLSLLLREELTRRGRAKEDTRHGDVGPGQHLVVLIDAGRTLSDGLDESLVEHLLTQGPAVGIYTVVIAPDLRTLPSDCAALIEVHERGPASLRVKEPPRSPVVAEPEQVDVRRALGLARALSPMQISAGSFAGKIPNRVQLLDVLNIDDARDADVWSMWARGDAGKRLRAPIGQDANGPVYLDLTSGSPEGGPHGILGGTTGSGKSELLRSIVLAFAAAHHPHRLSFVLVDYKGGDAFEGLKDLPHVVGYITNLDEREANRALDALDYERKYRQVRLRAVFEGRDGDVATYQNLREQHLREGASEEDYPSMPNILIVIDEFAELKERIPAFIPRLNEIARQGRSLGIHMLLATQRPGGAVNEDIRANTAYWICLRVAEARDSTDVIGTSHASLLSRTVPGRGYLRIGTDPIREFQSALSTTPYVTRAQRHTESVLGFSPGFGQADLTETSNVQRHYGSTDLLELAERLRQVAHENNVQPLHRLILPSLPSRITLSDVPDLSALLDPSHPCWAWPDVPPTGWGSAPVGLLDRPTAQRQDALILDLPQVGHAFVCGSHASGKTTFLRTLALAFAATYHPQDLHLYVIDFGRAGLQPLRMLPHCGAIVHAGDMEKGVRLVTDLRRLSEERLALLKRSGLSTLTDYRAQTGQRLPYVVVLVDNFSMFHDAIAGDRPALPRQLAATVQADLAFLFREGHALGIHFVLADTTWRILRPYPTLIGSLGLRLALHQMDANDYNEVGVSLREAVALPPGRGFTSGPSSGECQIALPLLHHPESPDAIGVPDGVGGEPTAYGVPIGDQQGELDAFYTAIAATTPVRAPSIKPLPERVATGDLPMLPRKVEPTLGWPVSIGVTDRTTVPFGDQFEQVALTLGGGNPWYLVAGPAASGKTTLLHTLATRLHSQYPAADPCLVVVAPHRSALSEQAYPYLLCPAQSQVDGDLIALLTEQLAARQVAPTRREPTTPLVVLIDDLQEILSRDSRALTDLKDLAERHGQHGLTIVAAGLGRVINGYSSYDHKILGPLRAARTGALLCPEIQEDGSLFGLSSLPLTGPYPSGRGFVIRPTGYEHVQVAVVGPPV